MKQVCVTQRWWDKYVEICEHRKCLVSWPTKTALFMAEGDELVAGVLIYDTSGPHVFFEHLVTNQTAPLKLRHEAVRKMAELMMSHCLTIGKLPQIVVKHRGIGQILRKAGLENSGCWHMSCSGEQMV